MKALAGILATATAAAAPYAPLRTGPSTRPTTLTASGVESNKECTYDRRTARGVLQIVLHCHYARALKLAAQANRVVLSQFSQQGAQFVVVITGEAVSIEPAARSTSTIPLGWNVEYTDGNVTFADRFDSNGGALQRGTYNATTKQWTFVDAFGARFPATGQISMPLFIAHAGDPTIVYTQRPPAASDLSVRVGDGTAIDVPSWDGGPTTTTSRVSYSSALAVHGQALPAIAAKVAERLVVAFPIAPHAYEMRSLEGTADFSVPPPPTNAAPSRGPYGPRCSEVTTQREHEQLFAPQLFEWNGVGLAYLTTRTTETMRRAA